MKRIILSIAAVVAFIAVNAQNIVTTNWPNGNKKAEGKVIGDAKINTSDSKEEQAKKLSSLVKDGKWTTWFENGTLCSEEYYNHGAMVGTWKTVYENGQTESVLNFTTGEAVFYSKSGVVVSKGTIADGMLYKGKWTGFYENGNKNYTGSYDNQGKKDGTWTFWNEKGEIVSEQIFQNGTLLSTKSK
jgi:antitoxin component YwqK of YwqJK toxin-antitoxin module